MSKKLQLKIITPEKLVFNEPVDQVVIPTVEGEITVMPGHIPLISQLRSGDVIAFASPAETSSEGVEHIPFAIVGGFLEVNSKNEVIILADFAEPVSHMTEDVIAKARARAEEIRNMKIDKSHVDYEHFEAELERTLTRVKIADKWKGKKYR